MVVLKRCRLLRAGFNGGHALSGWIARAVPGFAAAFLCGLLMLMPIDGANADIRVGSISNVDSSGNVINGVTLDAPIMAASRAKLTDPEHFRGDDGTHPPQSVTITDVVKDAVSGRVLTPDLLAELDLFFVGQFSQEVLSVEDRDLLRDFVIKGGTLIVTCDIQRLDEVCNHFGYRTSATFPLDGIATPFVGDNHRLFIEPFRIEQPLPLSEGAAPSGIFASGQAFGDGMVLARTDGGSVRHAVVVSLEMGRGQVVLLSNAQMISSTPNNVTVSALPGIHNPNDRFLINLFALGASAEVPVVATAQNYACREVEASSALDPRPTVSYEDEFGAVEDAKLGKKAKILCMPVDLAGGPRPNAPSLTCYEADQPRTQHGKFGAWFEKRRKDDDDDHRWAHRHEWRKDQKHGVIVSHEFDDELTMIVDRSELICVVSEIEFVNSDVARDTIKWKSRRRDHDHRDHDHDDDDD